MQFMRITVDPTSIKITNDAINSQKRHYANHHLILLYKEKPYNADIVLWEEPKKFYHELKLFKTYHSTMDTTATRTRRIWDLPLLLQVPKLKTTLRGHAAFENYCCSYKYQN